MPDDADGHTTWRMWLAVAADPVLGLHLVEVALVGVLVARLLQVVDTVGSIGIVALSQRMLH